MLTRVITFFVDLWCPLTGMLFDCSFSFCMGHDDSKDMCAGEFKRLTPLEFCKDGTEVKLVRADRWQLSMEGEVVAIKMEAADGDGPNGRYEAVEPYVGVFRLKARPHALM